jgi:enamine deaminase RidA (YjgF/YER057c/UK114 family)
VQLEKQVHRVLQDFKVLLEDLGLMVHKVHRVHKVFKAQKDHQVLKDFKELHLLD